MTYSANATPVSSFAVAKFGHLDAQDSPRRSANGTTEAVYRLSNSKDVVMYLSGTTPIKDWTMCAHGLSGEALMVITRDNHLNEINSLNFSLPVGNLRGEQCAMDHDAYTALKADHYKDITFKLISATVQPMDEYTYAIAALGNLTVAGVTRIVTLKMRSQVSRDGSITFTGSEDLKMSDYNVERPSILFGTIKAGDRMTLSYTLIFNKLAGAL